MSKSLSPSQWSPIHAAHLLNRAGFGGTPAEIEAIWRLGLEGAVAQILSGEEDDDLFPPPLLTQPGELHAATTALRAAPEGEEKRKLQRARFAGLRAEFRELRAWWLDRMRYTPHPLREKMTLFWHGHFATSSRKVRVAFSMWQQNETLRAHALGDVRELAKQISRDPAMINYLDLRRSKRQKPNENFARELMELFLLGEGVCYTEEDIQESARAFTGYRIDQKTLSFRKVKRQTDEGEKVFMEQRGTFNGDEVIDIITAQNECSEFLAGKLWRFFAASPPAPGLIEDLASHYRASGFETRAILREIFLSEAFYAPAEIRSQIKSPVQWLVQTARVLEAPLPPQPATEEALKQMGQVLFEPPNVKGWPGGRAWITSATFLFRCNLAGYIVSGRPPSLAGFRRSIGGVDIPLETIAPAALRNDPERLCDAVSMRLINMPLEVNEREKLLAFLSAKGSPVDDETLRDFLHLVMSTPEYQVT